MADRQSKSGHLFCGTTLGFLQSKPFFTLYELSAIYLHVSGHHYEFCQGDLPFVFHFFSFFGVGKGDKRLSTSSFTVLPMIFSIMSCPVNKKYDHPVYKCTDPNHVFSVVITLLLEKFQPKWCVKN